MLKRYNQYFEEFMFDRTGEIEQEISSNNQRYRELNTEICEVQQALTDNLSPRVFDSWLMEKSLKALKGLIFFVKFRSYILRDST